MMKCANCGREYSKDMVNCQECGMLLAETLCEKCGNVTPNERFCDTCKENICPFCKGKNPQDVEFCQFCYEFIGKRDTQVVYVEDLDETVKEKWYVHGMSARFVGRDKEIGALKALMKKSLDFNSCKMVTLVGHPGVGKSRLVGEFLGSLPPQVKHYIGSVVNSDAPPFSLFSKIFKERFKIADSDSVETGREILLEGLNELFAPSMVKEIGNLIGYIIDLNYPDEDFKAQIAVDPINTEQRIYQAIIKLFQKDAKKNPLCLVFENIHWASNVSQKLILLLAEQLRNAPILIVCLTRDEFLEVHSKWGIGDFDHTFLMLDRLSDEEGGLLFKHMFRNVGHIPEVLVKAVIDKASGNPMQLERIFSMLIDQGVINREEKGWKIYLDKLDTNEIPVGFEGITLARFQSLPNNCQEVLEQAACVGNIFWAGVILSLQRLTESEEKTQTLIDFADESQRLASLKKILTALCQRDYILSDKDSKFRDDPQFRFKNDIERNIIYNNINLDRLKRYHGLIAQWFEQKLPDKSSQFVENIARNFELAGNIPKAVEYYVIGGDYAQSLYFNDKAIQFYQIALTYIPQDDYLKQLEVLGKLGGIYALIGEFEAAERYFGEMLKGAYILNNKAKAGVAYNKLGRLFRDYGKFQVALDYLEKGLKYFREAKDIRGIASSLDDIGKILYLKGDPGYHETLKYHQEALKIRRELNDKRSIALSLHNIGNLHLVKGNFKEALICFKESLDIRKEIEDKHGVALTLNSLGIIFHERANDEEALKLWQEAKDIVEEIGDRKVEGILLNNMGEVNMLLDNLTVAKNYLLKAVEIGNEVKDKITLTDTYKNIAQLFLTENKIAEAMKYANLSVSFAHETASELLISLSRKVVADVMGSAAYQKSVKVTEEPRTIYQEVIHCLQTLGNELELAKCQLAFGTYLLKRDKAEALKILEAVKETFARFDVQVKVKQIEALISGSI